MTYGYRLIDIAHIKKPNPKSLISHNKHAFNNNKLMLSYKNVLIKLVLFLKFIIPKRGITPLKSFTGQQ